MNAVLTIAGSDSCGGAGIQADLKTFEAFGVFGSSVITVLTAQNTTGVSAIYEVDTSFIKEQIKAVLADFDIKAIKIGMLLNKKVISTVMQALKDVNIPIVLDPVFISKVGSKLLEDEAIEELKKFCKKAYLITPNQFEVQQLFNSEEEIKNFDASVLVKKEEQVIDGVKYSVDNLYSNKEIKSFKTKFIDSSNLHGTGCTLSSAITANLALGKSLEDSISVAKNYVYEAILNAPNLGKGAGVILHKR